MITPLAGQQITGFMKGHSTSHEDSIEYFRYPIIKVAYICGNNHQKARMKLHRSTEKVKA